MSLVTFSGFPRIGLKRELKHALESRWRGETDVDAVLDTARTLRRRHWQLAVDAGADVVPCNDFSPHAIGLYLRRTSWTAISRWRAGTSAAVTICARWK